MAETFASIVGFLFLDTRVLGLPIPLHRDFEEVNLWFHVRRKTAEACVTNLFASSFRASLVNVAGRVYPRSRTT